MMEEEKERIFERMLEVGKVEKKRVPSLLKKAPPKKWLILLLIIVIVIATAVFYFISPKEVEIKKVIRPVEEKVIEAVGSKNVSYRESDGRWAEGHIYWPLGEEEIQHPGIVFIGRGGIGGWMEMYSWFCEGIAKNGYVVMIFEPTNESNPFLSRIGAINGTWSNDLKDAITYLTTQDPFREMVDERKIGIVGHSLGGIVVTSAPLLDDRAKAVVAISEGDLNKISDLKVPIQIIGGDHDLLGVLVPPIPPRLVAQPSYELANPPKQLIMIKAATDLGFTTFLNPFYPKPSWQQSVTLHYATAWFDYFLKSDPNARKTLVTPIDSLSTAFNSRYNLDNEEVIMAGPGANEEKES
jgi:dienelactone hydrolase